MQKHSNNSSSCVESDEMVYLCRLYKCLAVKGRSFRSVYYGTTEWWHKLSWNVTEKWQSQLVYSTNEGYTDYNNTWCMRIDVCEINPVHSSRVVKTQHLHLHSSFCGCVGFWQGSFDLIIVYLMLSIVLLVLRVHIYEITHPVAVVQMQQTDKCMESVTTCLVILGME